MATDATTTPPEVATTATPTPPVVEPTPTAAPVPGEQTATPTPAPAEPASTAVLKGLSKGDMRAKVVETLAAKRATGAAVTAKPTPEPAAPVPASPAAPAKADEPPPPAAEPPKEPSPVDKDLEAARILNETAQAAQRLQRKQREIAERERQIADREQKAQAEAARIAEETRKREAALAAARTAGRELDILRAAGIPDERLRSDFFVNALSQMTDEPTAPAPPTPAEKPLSPEEVKELIRQEREAAIKAETERRQAEGAAQLKASQDRYFGALNEAFKTGDYPLVSRIKPTQGEMNDYLLRHRKETGVALPPAELLRHFEERYKKEGLTVASAPKPAPPPPTAAPARTISQAATSDAGTESPPPQPKKERSIRELRDEGFRKWQESRGKRAAS